MDKVITKLDGTTEEQTKEVKKFFGLKPNQSFQNLDTDKEETD